MPTDPKKNKKNQSRTELKKQTKKKSVDEAKKGKAKKSDKEKTPRRRILPIWLRLMIVFVLSAVALLLGLMVGYGVLGEGNPTDALNWSTWQHIWDIVTKTKE